MHTLGSWCERYRSGTGARQSDRSSLWIKTRSALRLYFARSAPRSLHAPLRSHALAGAKQFSDGAKQFSDGAIAPSSPALVPPLLHSLPKKKQL